MTPPPASPTPEPTEAGADLMDEPMILHPDQADELRRLLGTVEDWLLHTSLRRSSTTSAGSSPASSWSAPPRPNSWSPG